MEKMKMSVGTMVALVVVVAAVSALVMNFGMVQAAGGDVKIGADLKIKQKGLDVVVKVKANGLEPNEDFAMRAYSSENCAGGLMMKDGPVFSNDKGKIKFSVTIPGKIVDSVNSVSIRDDTGTSKGPIVVCFHDTT